MLNTNPILSIIVPAYNIEKYVDFCIPTYISSNLFGKVIIIFVDDGATDNTKQKLQPFLDKYPSYFIFFHKENGGHGSVINYALTKCIQTKYFKIIDGDDWVSSDELYKLVSYLEQCDDELVISDYARVYKDKTIVCHSFSSGTDVNNIFNYTILLHTSTFKTSLFVDNKITVREKVFYEDIEFVLYPLEFVSTFSYCECCPYYYRLDNPNQSVSRLSFVKHYHDLYLVTHDIAKHLTKLKNENNKMFGKSLKHSIECLGGYYYVLLDFQLRGRELIKSIRQNDNELKRVCPDLRNGIKKANKFSRIFFSFNFAFTPLLKHLRKK